MGKLIDLTNKVFGDYKVVSLDKTKGKYKYYWNCVCLSCGQEKSIASHSIKSGKSTRCQKCNPNYGKKCSKGYQDDLTGKKFGHLLVNSFSFQKDTHSYWECVCDCGNHCVKSSHFLKTAINRMCDKCFDYYKNIENVLNIKNIKNNYDYKFILYTKQKKYNSFEIFNEYVIINNKIIIDKEDLDLIKSFKRYISIDSRGYAYFSYFNKDVYLHRMLINVDLFYSDKVIEVCDHINGNRLDNRKENLRVVDRKGNAINAKTRKDNTSGKRGVSWLKRSQKWQVDIQYDNQKKYIGVFSDFREALKAREEAENKYFGIYKREEK